MGEPIRVLNVVTVMNRAGLESRLMDIYRNIDRTRVQLDFYTNRTTAGEFDGEIESLGGRVFRTNPITAGGELRKRREFRSFLKGHPEYSIVHSHVNEWSSVFLAAAKAAGVPVRIAHSRGANKTLSTRTLYKDLVRLPINLYATHRFAVSKEAGEHLFGRHAVAKGTVTVMPNAIETERFHYDPIVRARKRVELGLGDDLVAIHVGNLSPVKNHAFLLEVFSMLHDVWPTSRLLLVGEGPERQSIETSIGEYGLGESVILLGKRSDVSELLQAADIFVFPSFHEGFPGAVLEAETAGLPCVISDSITREVAITRGVKQLPTDDANRWVGTILDLLPSERTGCVDEVRSAGYDIRDLVGRLEAFYAGCVVRRLGD